LWLFLRRHTNFSRQPLTLLHFAPEPDFGKRLASARGVRYVSADLLGDRTPRVITDITALGLRECSFDAIVCSHVLEHVPNDRLAMKECRRVLKPGGWFVVQVPMQDKPTDEDLSVTDPTERERRFGQDDHVRVYGPDVMSRLQEAGFRVTAYPPAKVIRDRDGDVGIPPSEPPVLFCVWP
jgi:SAM-dependent methyltransferase